MAKIPFVVQPRLKPIVERIGNDDVGYIEIERRGFLTVAEKAFMQAALEEQEKEVDLYALVSQISAAEGKAPKDVIDDLQSLADSEPKEYLAKYSSELSKAFEGENKREQQTHIFATAALLKSRVDVDIEMEDILELHPVILEGFYRLYSEEDKKTLDRLEEQAAALESKEEGAPEGK